MDMTEKQCIHTLFAAKDYIELYRTQKPTIDLMLGMQEQWEFEDFLKEEATEKVTAFLQEKLPEAELSSKCSRT